MAEAAMRACEAYDLQGAVAVEAEDIDDAALSRADVRHDGAHEGFRGAGRGGIEEVTSRMSVSNVTAG